MLACFRLFLVSSEQKSGHTNLMEEQMKNKKLANTAYIFACAIFFGGFISSFLSYAQDAHEERAMHKEHAERFEIRL